MNYYHQHHNEPEVSTTKWLTSQLQRYLDRVREDKQKAEYEKAKAREGKPATPATPVNQSNDTKPAKKGKSGKGNENAVDGSGNPSNIV